MTRKADGIPPPLVQAQPPRRGGRSWVTSPRKEFYNMTEQEKMEIVVVDIVSARPYHLLSRSASCVYFFFCGPAQSQE